MEGHGFDSRRGPRFCLCPTLVTAEYSIFLKNCFIINSTENDRLFVCLFVLIPNVFLATISFGRI